MTPRFTADDLERASADWFCNCGPSSVAAICGLTLDEVKPHFDRAGYPGKHYTNPTMMFAVLGLIGKQSGTVELRIDSASPPTTVRASAMLAVTGSGDADTVRQMVVGIAGPGDNVRLVSAGTGTPTIAHQTEFAIA